MTLSTPFKSPLIGLRRALWSLVAVTAASLLLATLLLHVPVPQTDAGYVLRSIGHALLEWTSVGLGLGVSALAILYWWIFGRALLPALVGSVFGFAGILDGLQAALTGNLWGSAGVEAEQATTVVVRVFIATGYVALACCGRERKDGSSSLRPVWMMNTLAGLTAFIVVALGRGWLSASGGAWPLFAYLPAALLLGSIAIGSRHRREGKAPPVLAVVLLASVVPQLLAEWISAYARGPEAVHMLAAHALKLWATGIVLLGLAYELGQRQRVLLAGAACLEQAHHKLDRQNSNLARTQQLISHQKEQLDMALAAGGTGSFVWHVEEDALVLDDHLQAKFGLSGTAPGCMSRDAFAGRIHEEDRMAFGQTVQRGLSGEGPLQSRFRLQGAEGELTVRCTGVVHRAPTGEPVKVVGVLTDVTQQAAAERERHQAEQRIRRFLDAMPLGVFVEDAQGETYYANDRARELLGRERSMHPEVLDESDLDGSDLELDDDESDLTLIGHLSVAVAGGQTAGMVSRNNVERLPLVRAYGGEESVEEVEVDAKGQKRIVRMWGAPIFGDGQDVEFAMAVMQDITATKQLEMERAQGQKLEAIGQLAAGIAHEINTPTQYVSDNTHFMETAFKRLGPFLDAAEAVVAANKEGEVTPAHLAALKKSARKAKLNFVRREVPKAIAQSLEGLERVATIVRAMKEFSHPGGGGMSPTDLNRAVKTTVTVARNEWKYVADVELDLAEELPNVPVLPDQLNQVILNIVVNGAHAIREKLGEDSADKGVIRISTRLAEDHAEIIITDDGIGVPEAIQERVFDPFFTTKSVGKGTGQGLAIARKVMLDGHHGDLRLDSVEGEGATFTLILPLEQPDTAEGTEEAAQ